MLRSCSSSSEAERPRVPASPSPALYRALTLGERLEHREALPGTRPALDADALALLQYRITAWQSQRPFDDVEAFRQRLNLDGLNQADLHQLLAEPDAALRDRVWPVPEWITTIESSLSSPATFGFRALLTDRLREKPATGFLDLAAPFIDRAVRDLSEAATRLANSHDRAPFDGDTVCRIFVQDLARALLTIMSRTLVLELHVAKLEGTLVGATPQQRFASFIESLSQPARRRVLFEEYPVLARLIVQQTTRWVRSTLEFLERLARDVDELQTTFNAGVALGTLVSASGDLADPRDGGRSVIIAAFSSGVRIVYKPKSQAVDLHFRELLRWMNAEGFQPAFPTMQVLDRVEYGWVEFAAQGDCDSVEALTRFYERIGGYLALLYVTDATDFHADNLIACGEHPQLIDVEALFQAREHPAPSADTSAADRADYLVRYSVLRNGLLPERLWVTSADAGIDQSGLGTPDGQLWPYASPEWADPGTDTMRLVRTRHEIDTSLNRPTLNGTPTDVRHYRDAIVRGFRSAYRLLQNRRQQLLGPEGPLSRFESDAVCIFMRSARTYRKLLRESYHPDVLRDALDRDRLFDLLWMEVADDARLADVMPFERAALARGDIPSFTARPASRDVWIDGNRFADFTPESSLAAVRRLVDGMDEDDCDRQVWFIDASLASLPGAAQPTRSPARVPHRQPVDPKRVLAAADAIGDRLDTLAIRGVDDASWIGLELDRGLAWTVESSGLDLDAGVPGMALFLAYLGVTTGNQQAAATADRALASIRHAIADRSSPITAIGAFEGLGGLIYVWSHLATLWNRADLAVEAEGFARTLSDSVDEDDRFDVFGGSAGAILALRSLQQVRPSARRATLLVRCGDHLLKSARRDDGRLAWPGVDSGSGFGFGTAGIAYALCALYESSGLDRFRVAGREALDASDAAVAQTRTGPAGAAPVRSHGSGAQTGWCHGTVGHALARPGAVAGTSDAADVRAENTHHWQAVRSHGFGHDHSLCHGDLGSLMYLLDTAVASNDRVMEDEVATIVAGLLDSVEERGWRCGTPIGVETPGLLTGLSGIGLGLLRLAHPTRVPSVLTLAPPVAARARQRRASGRRTASARLS